MDDIQCWVSGECEGIYLSGFASASANNCLDDCKSDKECQWFNYNSADGTCVLLQNCTEVAECDTCLTGQRACSERKGAHETRGSLIGNSSFFFIHILPSQPPTVVWKMEAQLECIHIAYTFYSTVGMLCRCFLTIFLRRSSVGS